MSFRGPFEDPKTPKTPKTPNKSLALQAPHVKSEAVSLLFQPAGGNHKSFGTLDLFPPVRAQTIYFVRWRGEAPGRENGWSFGRRS